MNFFLMVLFAFFVGMGLFEVTKPLVGAPVAYIICAVAGLVIGAFWPTRW